LIGSILVILRDRGIPLPAGAILISPWVDLTHSFPSLAGDGSLDFIPAHGFLHRPSISWPPPSAEDMEQMAKQMLTKSTKEIGQKLSPEKPYGKSVAEATIKIPRDQRQEALHSTESVVNPIELPRDEMKSASVRPGLGHYLSITVAGETIDIKDQIQMYATNQLISHPLVSPVLQSSLGGLPPLLILTGGGELLRDEQIYIAHKAANPSRYPPGEDYLQKYPEAREVITKWRPTDVQLQVWDDLCHVAPTLSFTRPAKYMYRSIAHFGAWALARAQKSDIEIQDDDNVSIISSASPAPGNQPLEGKPSSMNSSAALGGQNPNDQIGKVGGALPPFRNHMIRQRVDRRGIIYPLEPASSLPCLQVPANEIGVIKPGPVLKWKEAQTRWNSKFAKDKRRVQIQRVKDIIRGFEGFGDDEIPPPSALAGRRCRNVPMKPEGKKPRNWGMSLWSLWGSSHDEKMV
jgi:acetyl esterase/lipase